MTRINIVSVEDISNKHLMAEYRELPRIFTTLQQHIDKGRPLDGIYIPNQYVLGKGHMTFFYNKLAYLRIRFSQIRDELIKRGYEIDNSLFTKIYHDMWDLIEFTNDFQEVYHPTHKDKYLNWSRMCKRSGMQKVLEELEAE